MKYIIEIAENKRNIAEEFFKSVSFIKNVKEVLQEDAESYSLAGTQMDVKEFKQWVEQAEDMPVVSLTDAKTKWEQKKKQLKSIT